MPKVPITGLQDFSLWYTPGVAAAALAIAKDAREAERLTNRANAIAIVSDGTRVLGLGSIGPTAALPVMEGKALLFKYLGGVDAVPLCLAVRKESDLIAAVEALQPNFGGINLEDIEQPKCFRVLARLSRRLKIPVWHDDQQGSATVVLAGLMNALHVVGKSLPDVRIAMIGMGAANVATYRLLKASGVKPARIIACDSKGTLHRGRSDIARQHRCFAEKWRVARETNPTCIKGGIAQALQHADVAICFTQSGPDIINPAWVKRMAPDAIIFACANPVPEIWPTDAKAAGARIVATGRSDFPNQVNNALVFPGLFRGTLDCHASHITDEMALAGAEALAKLGRAQGLTEDRLLPTLDDLAVAVEVAVAVGLAAKRQGLAGLSLSANALRKSAEWKIGQAREALLALTRAGLIAPWP